MAITQAMCTSFKIALLDGEMDFSSDTSQTFKIALFTSSATLDATTTAYSTTNEVSGTGYTAGGNTLSISTNPTNGGSGNTERMRILSDGWVGITDNLPNLPNNADGIAFNQNGRVVNRCDVDWNLELYGNQGNRVRLFTSNGGGTQVGSITVSTTNASFNTTSDHRLKENVTADWDATTRLKQLNPVRFNFISDVDTTVDGFLAHEVQSVVPEAITGTYNEVDDDGNAVYQGIDQSKLVPLLVKTIQELEARIVALETA